MSTSRPRDPFSEPASGSLGGPLPGRPAPPFAGGDARKPLRPCRVEKSAEISAGVFLLEVALPLDFLPGQCVAISVNRELPPRFYSIASAPGQPVLSVLYDLVEDGLLTPRLSMLRGGDTVYVSGPFGTFVDDGRSAWIATGTGVAPFLSMVRAGMAGTSEARAEGADPARILVHGARTIDRFYFSAELEAALGDAYVRCLSGTGNAPGAMTGPAGTGALYRGRLTSWLREVQPFPAFDRYMLCGSPGMVVDVREILIARGIPFDAIVAEIYF